ncbi:MAG TPA: phage shock protein PspA [Candidatus Sumerlaeota bacterium]|nr:MAG: Phage shock protein A [candidate division BRC1 bacterium ADurb.BinA292]HOE97526.1 phage shock protein PspA [Candidatus Sumerlaeota bacterium]HOR27190.1 phage shock protein PspA [Candidatus Sumerlaeota bacterium]HPK02503.1 phage shock protein PspA [Candidatus Sumerlaeota bacterium]
MGIFTRFRDIVSANLNAILDRAEDPEKMVRLMIQEMEDTLIEVKSNCAGVLAEQKKLERALKGARREAADWEAKAGLALQKQREDLARAALAEKRRHEQRVRSLEEELDRTRENVASFKDDIAQLEAKLNDAREKQRTIIQRRQAAESRFRTAAHVRRVDTTEAFARFEAYERGIDRLEAEADLVDSLRPRRPTLRDELADLEYSDEIEQELERLKEQLRSGSAGRNA